MSWLRSISILLLPVLLVAGCATTDSLPPEPGTVYFTPVPKATTDISVLTPPRNAHQVPGLWPLDCAAIPTVISPYGPRPKTRNSRTSFHEGMDIKGPRGSNVIATADGTVIMVGWMNGFGRVVKVDHGNGYTTVYGHQSSFAVRQGQKVKRGDVLGAQGASGNASTSHVHYEVLKDGKYLNPTDFLPGQ